MKTSLGAKTLLFPTPVLIIGTYGENDSPNIMTASWGGICCSNPPCVSVAVRPERLTHTNIMARRAFTVNVPSADHVKEADYIGIYSGKTKNKFAECKLTPAKSEYVDAPSVEQFPLVLECELFKDIDLGIHALFVGRIMDVKADPTILDADGSIDIGQLRPLTFSPSDRGYYALGGFVGQAFDIGK